MDKEDNVLVSQLSTKQDQMIAAIKSFSNRWCIMLPILKNFMGKGRLTQEAKGKAKARLVTRHFRAVSELLPEMSESRRLLLVAEIVSADTDFLEECINNELMGIDRAKQLMQSRISPPHVDTQRELVRATEEAEVNQFANQLAEGPPIAVSLSRTLEEEPFFSEEEEFPMVMAMLAISQLRRQDGVTFNLSINHELIELIQSLIPGSDKDGVSRFVEFLKKTAGPMLAPLDTLDSEDDAYR